MNRLEQEIQKVLTHYNYLVQPHHPYYQKVKEIILGVCNDLMGGYRGYEDQFESHNYYYVGPPIRIGAGERDWTNPNFIGYLTRRDINDILGVATRQIIQNEIQRRLNEVERQLQEIDPLNIVDTQRWIDVERHIDAHYRFVISNPPPTQTARSTEPDFRYHHPYLPGYSLLREFIQGTSTGRFWPEPIRNSVEDPVEDPEAWERVWERNAHKVLVPYKNGEVCEKCWIESGIVVSEAGCRHSTYLK